jgi:hypothetical protein
MELSRAPGEDISSRNLKLKNLRQRPFLKRLKAQIVNVECIALIIGWAAENLDPNFSVVNIIQQREPVPLLCCTLYIRYLP